VVAVSFFIQDEVVRVGFTFFPQTTEKKKAGNCVKHSSPDSRHQATKDPLVEIEKIPCMNPVSALKPLAREISKLEHREDQSRWGADWSGVERLRQRC
jgi:hypothetical protein